MDSRTCPTTNKALTAVPHLRGKGKSLRRGDIAPGGGFFPLGGAGGHEGKQRSVLAVRFDKLAPIRDSKEAKKGNETGFLARQGLLARLHQDVLEPQTDRHPGTVSDAHRDSR